MKVIIISVILIIIIIIVDRGIFGELARPVRRVCMQCVDLHAFFFNDTRNRA